MAKQEGKTGKFYENTGTYGSPTWNLITGTRDQKLPLEWGDMEVGDRDIDYKTYLLERIELGFECDAIWNKANTDLTGLRTACLAGTAKEYAIMDGPIATAGSIGMRVEMIITGFSHDRPLSDGDKVSLKFKPYGGYTNAPASYTVSA